MHEHDDGPTLNDSCSEAPPLENGEQEYKFKPSKLLLAILFFGSFLGTADETFVLTTAREIAESFQKGPSSMWLITGYNMGYSMALPIYGRLYEVAGQRRTFLLVYALYGVGCGVTAAMPFYVTVFGRFLTGLGASGMLDLASVVLNDMGSPREVAVLRSYIMISSVLGLIGGAPLGAFLTSALGWRVSFLVHIPFVIACALVTFFRLSPGPRSGASCGNTSESENDTCEKTTTRNRPSLDIPGMIALSATIFCFVFLVQMISHSDWSGRGIGIVVGLAVAFLVCLTVFIIIEAYWASNPIIPYHLVRHTQVGLVWGTTFLLMMGAFSLLSSVGPYSGRVFRFHTLLRGVSLAPLAVGATFGSILTGKAVKRTGRQKPYTICGLGICIIGLLIILLRWTIFSPNVYELLYTFIFGLGFTMVLSAQFIALSSSTTDQHAATSITSYYLFQQAGIMIGVTLTQSFQNLLFRKRLEARLGSSSEAIKIIQKSLANIEYQWTLPHAQRDLVDSLFRQSYVLIPAFEIVVLLGALLLVIKQREHAI